jgi:DNA-binding ferritin-like protein (Dps family)
MNTELIIKEKVDKIETRLQALREDYKTASEPMKKYYLSQAVLLKRNKLDLEQKLGRGI